MTQGKFRLRNIALALGVVGLLSFGLPMVGDWLAPEGGFVSRVQAEDSHSHTEGSTTSHGHSEGSSGGKPPWAGTPGGRNAFLSGGATGGHSSGGHSSGGSSGGHSSGGSSGGDSGHSSGGSSGHSGASGGGHSGGSSGGHTSGGHESGGGGKGKGKGGPQYGKSTHGSGEKHSGHVSGQHGSDHETGADRHFGGGSGLHGPGGVPEGIGNGKGGRRYWGGWAIPDEDGDGTPTQYAEDTSVFYINPGPGGGGSSRAANLSGTFRCSDVGAKASQAARFSKANMERGHEVQRLLNSDATAPDDEYREHALLANLQQEMLKPVPDPATVGTYIGVIAHTEVTPELVTHVCFHMCVPSADSAFMNEVAANANTVRLALK